MGLKKALKLLQKAEQCISREDAQKILRKWDKNEAKKHDKAP